MPPLPSRHQKSILSKHLIARILDVFKANSTQVPCVVAGIIYAANTETHIAYIDCLFLAVSAATVTGLATVDLSSLNAFQQALLMLLFVCGSMVCPMSLLWID